MGCSRLGDFPPVGLADRLLGVVACHATTSRAGPGLRVLLLAWLARALALLGGPVVSLFSRWGLLGDGPLLVRRRDLVATAGTVMFHPLQRMPLRIVGLGLLA